MLLDRRQLSPWGHGIGSSPAPCQQLLRPPVLTATRLETQSRAWEGQEDRAQAVPQADMGWAATESKELPQATADGLREPRIGVSCPQLLLEAICAGTAPSPLEDSEPNALDGWPLNLRAGQGHASQSTDTMLSSPHPSAWHRIGAGSVCRRDKPVKFTVHCLRLNPLLHLDPSCPIWSLPLVLTSSPTFHSAFFWKEVRHGAILNPHLETRADSHVCSLTSQ